MKINPVEICFCSLEELAAERYCRWKKAGFR
jgi:hypothetical protein